MNLFYRCADKLQSNFIFTNHSAYQQINLLSFYWNRILLYFYDSATQKVHKLPNSQWVSHILKLFNSFLIVGMCIKAFKLKSKEKFFINICHTSEIPAPKDITETELHKLLETQNATGFKVPLSVTKPRETKDKSGSKTEVSDIAVNTDFYAKKVKRGDGLFYHFLITLVFESLEQKYKIELDTSNFVQLKNRACIDQLVEHQIYNRDVKTVEQYHADAEKPELLGADDEDKIIIGTSETKKNNGKVLIQEISAKNELRPRKSIANEPEHRLVSDRQNLIAEFYLPHVRNISEVQVEANDDRLVLNSQKHGYTFDGFLPQKINESKTRTVFDIEKSVRF